MRKIIYYIIRLISILINRIKKEAFVYIIKYKTDSFKNGLQLDYPATIIYPEYLKIGKNCRINRNVYIHAEGGVVLGDNVTISATARIISTSYGTSDWKINSIKKEHYNKEIIIGDNSWICAGATILPGVRIGKGVIVAANSVVTKDVLDSYVLVAGSPAVVKKRLLQDS